MARLGRDVDETPEDAGDTLTRLERLARLIRQANHCEGLLPVHWEILRFLGRASRHSRSHGAVSGYLGMSKGTTSQSLSALVRKGLIARQALAKDKRQQNLMLTAAGRTVLQKDPLAAVEQHIMALGGKTRRRFDQGLAELLNLQIETQGVQRFGTCTGCRHFSQDDGAATCAVDGLRLSDDEQQLLCAAHESQ